MLDISEHRDWYAAYAARERAKERSDPGPIDLKVKHTWHVLDNAALIVRGEVFPPHLRRACLLAALYHDVARFEQYLRYRTFRDRESIDHGRLGVVILKREKRLTRELSPIPHLVMTAVGLHNRFALPRHMAEESALACKVVRDADKLDILRVIDEHLSGPKPYSPTVVMRLPDAPDSGNPKVAQDALQGRIASYTDLRSVNDFRVLLGTWYYEMHFSTSQQQYRNAGHAASILRGLPDDARYGEVRAHLLKVAGL